MTDGAGADTGEDDPGDAGFDEWLDALASGEGFYLGCEHGHGSLPPRRVCPDCGSPDLTEEPLPAEGTVETFTTVHVAAPTHADDAPYVTAVVDFGPVRLTGIVVGEADRRKASESASGEGSVPRADDVDTVGEAEPVDVDVGDAVVPDRGVTETEGEATVVFRRA